MKTISNEQCAMCNDSQPRKMKDSGIEWIGEIPEGWRIKKLKYLAQFKQKKYSSEHGNLSYIGLENIVSWNGKYVSSDSEYDKEQSIICEQGDILFGKLRPYLAKVYLNDKKQCCSSEFCVIGVCRNDIRYYWFQLISHGFIFTVDRSTYGTKMPRANADFIKNINVVVPPLPEQQSIAAHLDRICSEIDSVTAKTKATIEEYKKLKQAVITEAVTKGIRKGRKMKDSGIEWIGEIPEEWEQNTVFQLFTQVKNKNIDLQERNLLSLSYGKIKRKSIETIGGLLPESFDGYNIIEKNDIVLRLTDLQNDHKSLRVGLATERGIVTSAYLTIRNRSKSISNYLYYYLHSFDISKGFYGMGAGVRQGLSWEGIKWLKILTPPLLEQQEIVAYLDKKCAAIDTLIAKKEQLLTELESYKKSVIYEYVTGKKEILI